MAEIPSFLPRLSLPALREELALYPGPHLPDGQPTWTLHDPVRNQFFRIDWLSFEIIRRWSLGDPNAITTAIREESTLHPDAADIEAVIQFLVNNQMVQPGGGKAQIFAAHQAKMRGSWLTWLLHHYLFFRIPLLRPDAWLERWANVIAPLYSRTFAQMSMAAMVLGAIGVYRDWDRFSSTLIDTFSIAGLLGYGSALIGVKVIHELGHAFTAKRYGCRVPAMGVAFLVMLPVAYTDTNEVWKLPNRRQRLAVASAGVAAELVVAMWATLAWSLLPEGQPKSIAFVLATTTWIASIAINASPFMRFDGYFLLADWLEMPNLHSRAFALARWDLRERLFGLCLPPPEFVTRRMQLGLVLFAYATWIYRLVVFIGIAALVYAFFIKAVGIALFIVEIGWFVLLPVWSEIKLWPELLKSRDRNDDPAQQLIRRSRTRRSALLALTLAIMFIFPWPTRQSASALLKAVDVAPIYAPAGAQLVKLPWAEGSTISAEQTVLELASPELHLRWNTMQAKLARLRWQASNADVDADQRQNQQVLQQDEITATSELASLQADMKLYAPTAPFSGVLRDLNPELKPGVWVAKNERLGVLVKPDKWQIETWLDEDQVRRIQVGNRASFYADSMEGPMLLLSVHTIEADATRTLPYGQLASRFGGSIVTREKNGQLVPELAMYKVTLRSDSDLGSLSQQSWRGHVVIHGKWEAPGLSFLRTVLVVMWREFGF